MNQSSALAGAPIDGEKYKAPKTSAFGNILDLQFQTENLRELVFNLSGKKIVWSAGSPMPKNASDLLDLYYSNRAGHSDIREWFTFRLINALGSDYRKAMDSSMAFTKAQSNALTSMARELTEKQKNGNFGSLPDIAQEYLERKVVDLRTFKRYFENLFSYLFYSTNTSDIEKVQESLVNKFDIIHKIKFQILTHVQKELEMENEASKKRTVYIPSILLRILIQIAEEGHDDPISGFIRTILRESHYLMPNDHIGTNQWDYFACNINDETLKSTNAFFKSCHGFLGEVHLKSDPGKQIIFGGNSFYGGSINLPRSGTVKTYFGDFENAPVTFMENTCHFALLQGGHGLKIKSELPSVDFRGIPTKPSGPLFGAKLINAANGHDTEIWGGLCLAILIDSLIGATFHHPGDGRRTPALAARFLGNSGRNSYWKTPVKQVRAEDGALNGAVLERGIVGGTASEDAYRGAVVTYVGPDLGEGALPIKFTGKSGKDIFAAGKVLTKANFEGTDNMVSGENMVLLGGAGSGSTFSLGGGKGALIIDADNLKVIGSDQLPLVIRINSNPRSYYLGTKQVDRSVVIGLYNTKLEAIESRLKNAVAKFAEDHSILQYEILKGVGANGLQTARIDWRRHLSGLHDIPPSTGEKDRVLPFLIGIEKVLGKCDSLVHEEIPRQTFIISLNENEEDVTVPASLEDDNDPFFSSEMSNPARRENELIEKRNFEYYQKVTMLFASSSVVPERDYVEKELRKLWTTKAESVINGIQWSKMPLNPDPAKSKRIADAIADIIKRTIITIDHENTSLTRSLDAHISLIATLVRAIKELELKYL